MLSTLRKLTSKNPWREMPRADRTVFGVCVAAAFTFWLILNLSEEYTIVKQVELSYTTDPERVLVGNMPHNVQTEINGQGWNLIWESIRGSSLPVTVDVRDRENLRLTSSEIKQRIERRLSNGDLSADIYDFNGATILTTPKEGKRIPIRPRLRVRFKPGYFAPLAPRLSPDSITVNGAQDELELIDYWETEPITVDNLGSDLDQRVALRPPPVGIEISQNSVRYQLPVDIYIQERITVPIEVIHPPQRDSFRIFPTEAVLQLSVPQADYGDYSAEDFRLVADLANKDVSGDLNQVPLRLVRQPDDLIGLRVLPASVEYFVYRR